MSSRENHDHHGLRFALGTFGYQFITTGYPIQYKTDSKGFSVAQGSAVYIKLPKIKDDTIVDWTQLKPIPTGSTLRNLPDGTLKESDIQKIQYINNLIQIQLVPEPVHYSFSDLTKTYHSKVVNSWSGQSGNVYCAGWMMLVGRNEISDIGYDMPPAVKKDRKPIPRMPDADWPDSACRVLVTSEEYGSRYFIVMVDARSRFYCWPDQYDSQEYIYPPDSPYIQQSIKTNVSDNQVQWIDAPFPDWVHHFPTGFARRDKDFKDINGDPIYSGEPRYVWRFHPLGNKVVGIVLKREPLVADVFANHSADGLPLREYNAGPLKIDVSWRGDRSVEFDDIQTDTYGLVEFAITIAITGNERNQFTLSMSLLRQVEAGLSHYPIAADYLSPIETAGGWAARGVSAQPGELVVAEVNVYTDELPTFMYPRYLPSLTRKTVLTIKSLDTASTILNFICADNENPLFLHDVKQVQAKTFYARLRQIDLSKLNFSYLAAVDCFDFDPVHYAPTKGDEGVDIKVFQRWLTVEQGLRVFVLGQKVYEQRYGSECGVWGYADQTVSGLERIEPSLQGTRWLSKPSYSGERWYLHSLLSYVAHSYEVTASDFSTEMASVLSFLGGHAGLADSFRDYTIDYWNDSIVPAMADIVDKASEMTTAEGFSVTTRHAASLYNDIDINAQDDLLSYNSSIKFPKVYDYPIGAELYMLESNALFESQANFDVISDLSGFYAIALDFVYIEDRIPNYSYFLGANSLLAATRYDEDKLPQYTYMDADFSLINKPNPNIFKLATIDEVGHINGGKTSHASLYQQAYKEALTPKPLQAYVDVVSKQYDMYVKINYKLNGASLYSTRWVFDTELNTANPRLNGAGYFL